MRRVVRAGRVFLGLVAALAWGLSNPAAAWAHGSHGSSGGSHGSSGGSSGGWYSHGSHGSSGGSSGGWHSHGSHGSSGGSSGGYNNGAPQAPPSQSPSTTPAPAPPPAPATGMAVRLTVTLPPEAKLFIEDQPTQLTGNRRDFISPQLKRGQAYIYTLKVELMQDGQMLTKTEKFPVKAGQHAIVEFGQSALNPSELVASVRR